VKQVYQDIRSGRTQVGEVPAPAARAGSVLVHVGASLVSAGTERMVVEFAGKNLLRKVRARPDLARQVIEKARRDGVWTTVQAVLSRLDQPVPLGYSVAGTVIDAGQGVPFRPGDRVACAGAGSAVHAEVVCVPGNLVAPVPDGVTFDEACFATLGAIALHGVRLGRVELGGTAAVIGLGLLGQLTVQLLRASGATPVGMDPNPNRAGLARELGAGDAGTSAEALKAAVDILTGGRGVDAVMICADTPSNDPLELAAEIVRDRGVVVAVGAVGLQVPRKPFFEKEVEFRVSRSYGPGRYDPEYEERGHDYPYGFVRWTEQRNLDAVIRLMADRQLRVDRLITHRFDIAEADQALRLVAGKTGEPYLAVLLRYPPEPDRRTRLDIAVGTSAPPGLGTVKVGVVGAGIFAHSTLLPILRRLEGVELRAICAGAGLAAASAARKYGFTYACTTAAEVLGDADVSALAVLTRHSSHAQLVIQGLEAGKHVFVEKPLCVSEEQLALIEETWQRTRLNGGSPFVMVGFNRRFAPFVTAIAEALRSVREPLMLHYRVNAGFIPASHWVQHPAEGGRLVGEGCHFIDALIHLVQQPVLRVTARALPDGGRYVRDNFVVTLEFQDGSIGTVTYVANGAKGAGKEQLEVYGGGVAARLDDYRMLSVHDASGARSRRAWLRQDKGHRAEWEALVAFLQGRGPDPMPFETITRSMRTTLAAARSLETGETVVLSDGR
jgi:predicted dehydrogenase